MAPPLNKYEAERSLALAEKQASLSSAGQAQVNTLLALLNFAVQLDCVYGIPLVLDECIVIHKPCCYAVQIGWQPGSTSPSSHASESR